MRGLPCLTTVVVEHIEWSADERHRHLRREHPRLTKLHGMQRIRSGERRRLVLLHWIGHSFRQVNSRGCRLSLGERNLTHRGPADLCAGVTVTTHLSRFRQEG